MSSYSYHVSNGQNSINSLSDLAGRENHNSRLYENYSDWKKDNNLENDIPFSENVFLIGDENLVFSVKSIYEKEFSSAISDYNSRQTREDRKIFDYIQKISDSKDQQVATEIIIQVGAMEDWQGKSLDERKLIEPVFERQIDYLRKNYPGFKIAQAVIHYDESSPHLHIIGVPVGVGRKNGLSKKVQKSAIFNRKSLKDMQSTMRDLALEDCREIYGQDFGFKEKEKGRNQDFHKGRFVQLNEKFKELEALKDELKSLNSEFEQNLIADEEEINRKIADFISTHMYDSRGLLTYKYKTMLENLDSTLSEFKSIKGAVKPFKYEKGFLFFMKKNYEVSAENADGFDIDKDEMKNLYDFVQNVSFYLNQSYVETFKEFESEKNKLFKQTQQKYIEKSRELTRKIEKTLVDIEKSSTPSKSHRSDRSR